MAQIKVIGSSSKGNCYVIETSNECLVVECGFGYVDIAKAIDYKIGKISGCIVSHIHNDHAKYASELADSFIDVYCPEQMKMSDSLKDNINVYPLAQLHWHNVGGFKVMPFVNRHDEECFGYVIKHEEFKPILFATDTFAIDYKFNGIKNFMIEANYSDKLIHKLDSMQKKRLMISHLSFENCMKYLKECDAEHADNIILIHLSDRHSDEKLFKKTVEKTFGVPTTIAGKNVLINL